MLVLAIKYWKHILIAITVVAVVLIISHWRTEAIRVPGLEAVIKSMNEQMIAEREQNKKNQLITETVEQNYENNLTNLNNQLNSLRKQQTRCVNVFAATKANIALATAARKELPAGDARVTDLALYEIAGRCEQTRLKLIGLQKFSNAIYE